MHTFNDELTGFISKDFITSNYNNNIHEFNENNLNKKIYMESDSYDL
jgi:hypothetical protein